MSPVHGTTIILEPARLRIPGDLTDLDSFRAWVHSEAFPETGRIDWIGGEVSIDMSPEDLNTHNTPKAAIAGDLRDLVEARLDVGVVCADRMRVSFPAADLSVEPDVVVVRFDTIDSKRVRLVPKASLEAERYVEIQGPPDIVVECVSDSSETKDKKKLFAAYHEAGVPEYWLVDARGDEPRLSLYRHARARYREAARDRDGFARSEVLGVAVRLVRLPVRSGVVRYRLEDRVSGAPRKRSRKGSG
jgi:Uma2 family endonuclease